MPPFAYTPHPSLHPTRPPFFPLFLRPAPYLPPLSSPCPTGRTLPIASPTPLLRAACLAQLFPQPAASLAALTHALCGAQAHSARRGR